MNTMVSAVSLATATAIAVPPTAVQATALTESDAALIMLGEQFDVAVKEIIAARGRYDALYERVQEATEANATWPENQNDWSAEHAKQYFDALSAAQRNVGGPPLAEADTALNEAYGCTDKISKMVSALPVHSVGGLAVKARVAALACCHYWDDEITDMDWDKRHARFLIEATLQVAGAETVEGYLGPILTPAWSWGSSITPIVAALDRQRKAHKLFDRLWNKLNAAKDAAAKKQGPRPIELIAWRNYSHIGADGIERARKEFLKNGEDVSIVAQEYRDAKKRYRAIVKAGKDWDKRAGIDSKSKAVDEARAEFSAADKALGSVKLQSVADASALLDFVSANLKEFGGSAEPWELAALDNATTYLNRLTMLSKAASDLVGRRGWQA